MAFSSNVFSEWIPFNALFAEPLRNGIYKTKEHHGHGAKVVNMGELFAYPRLTASIEMKRVDLSEKEIATMTLMSGDLIFARRSLTAEGAGKCSIVMDVEPPTTFESSIIRVRLNQAKANPAFYYYFFNSPVGKHYLSTILRQVAVAGITGSDLARLQVPDIDKRLQDQIVSVLGGIDDKIELNRRMNQTLEAIAQALFKSWFVDFDPVRAKLEGREPEGMDAETAALFPSEFEDSEIGSIPEGWNVMGLNETGEFLNGLALQKFPSTPEEGLPVIKIADMRRGVPSATEFASDEIPSQYIVNDGDILFSWSGSLECMIWAGGIGALNQHLFKVTSASFPKWFVYLWIMYHLPEFRMIAAGKATTMGHIQRHHLDLARVIVPVEHSLIYMSKIMSPIFDMILSNNIATRTLVETRDALLPKLISGEVRVANLEGAEA